MGRDGMWWDGVGQGGMGLGCGGSGCGGAGLGCGERMGWDRVGRSGLAQVGMRPVRLLFPSHHSAACATSALASEDPERGHGHPDD